MRRTVRTREQKESNTLSQNTKSIHALNSNNAFENLINIFILDFYHNFQTSFNSRGFDLLSIDRIVTLSLICVCVYK